MIQKYIYSSIFIFFLFNLHAQVGINTDTPNPGTTLDVSGKVNITERIYLGGSDLNEGDPGSSQELIISGGPDDKPLWDVKLLPDGFGETFTMTYMSSDFDVIGVTLGANGSIPYTETMTLNDSDSGNNCPTAGSCWKVLSELNQTFPVYRNSNKVNFTFQTVAQTNVANTSSYACGIFLNSTTANQENPPLADFKLIGVRSDALLTGVAGDYKLFNMNVTLENLQGDPDGKIYAVRVGCRGRAQGASIAVGKPFTGWTNLNSDMSQSALNIFVLESWE